jgi:hypothetical protein
MLIKLYFDNDEIDIIKYDNKWSFNYKKINFYINENELKLNELIDLSFKYYDFNIFYIK